MAKKVIHTEVEGRKLKLSNLDKVLYPDIGVTKAEIIQYTMEIAPMMLPFVRGRALTLIRFPDGIGGTNFYTKSKPDWAPEWVKNLDIQHSKEPISYIIAEDTATLVWIANLAGLEIHPMQFTITQPNPDQFIFDLDPENDKAFEDLKELAYLLKEFLMAYDYYPLLKTSGSKGLHLIIPIQPKWDHEVMVKSVKELAKKFVKQNPGITTLKMNKKKRAGKTLIDIFRNHKAHTTVAPFSLRGKPTAPISLPMFWEDLEGLKDSKSFTIKNYKAYLDKKGNAWDNWRKYEVPLHDQKTTQPVALSPKDQSKLDSYTKKRNFKKTTEPVAEVIPGDDKNYVIQLHNASNLHYDLRLEVGGVLKSWAIPKGLPNKPGVKRLAIQTEDHPMKYLDFEGVIPKGEYGAGEMWVFEQGRIAWSEKGETKMKFDLISKSGTNSYSLYKTKNKQWLIERKNEPYLDISKFVSPMLADMKKTLPTAKNYSYEIKWDGIRTIICLDGDDIKIYSRSGRDITSRFPELVADRNFIKAEAGIFDGEIVCLDEEGRPLFSNVISRMHRAGEASIKKASTSLPVYCYLFDCINLDGKDITSLPLHKRQAWLEVNIKKGSHYRISESMTDGQALHDAAKQMDLEGVMAKKIDAPYIIGNRSTNWLKIKFRTTDDAIIIGYTAGQGDRSNLFGSLHLAKYVKEKLVYMGRIGTGFDMAKLKEVLALLKPLETNKRPIKEKVDKERETTWIEPKLYCELKYASLSSNGTYREPVFLRMRPDLG